ncbi:MAG: hypothetical protein HYZ37_03370, partial [Candidatus Solibacter usitatus]|nr:hypothetical protein [Candidatus Solibacter usitatus]
MRNFLFLWALSAVAQDPWAAILTPLKLTAPFGNNVLLPGETAALTTPQIEKRLQSGSLAILEGDSEASRHFGFHSTGKNVTVTSVATPLDRALQIVWEQPSAVPIFELPGDAIIFATERWQGAPLVAGLTRGAGAILWVALSPGNTGRERYPFLPQALAALGIHPPVTSQRLWLFFDSSYRLRADPDYLARRWRANGVAAMHIAAWHYFERDEGRDAYLRRLLDACHRNGIAAYAWLELPHVSETFWRDHPEWREKTALGQDAHLDWRMLMNLRNAACAKAVRGGVEDLLRRFDWDGVNLAELYFESLEGHHNASRFTPMNDDVRGEFRQLSGIDPVSLFDSKAEQHWSRNPSGLQQFLTYRAGLATRMQQEWIETLTSLRKEIPHLDLVLTHVDDFLEPGMKEKIGADAARVLPIADAHGITFLVEDPAPLWNQGPSRYTKLGAAYAKRAKSLAADINVVER